MVFFVSRETKDKYIKGALFVVYYKKEAMGICTVKKTTVIEEVEED